MNLCSTPHFLAGGEPCLGVKIVPNVLINRLTSHGGLGKHFSDYQTYRELNNLAARQSLSVAKPHEQSADGSGRNGEREKPPGFR